MKLVNPNTNPEHLAKVFKSIKLLLDMHTEVKDEDKNRILTSLMDAFDELVYYRNILDSIMVRSHEQNMKDPNFKDN